MQPIVDGLTETYAGQVTFRQLNANTDGADVYEALNLRGHPSYVILLPDETEIFRAVGQQDEQLLIDGLEAALESAP